MSKKVRAKKQLGQHFLNDLKIAENIVDYLPSGAKNVLEIGPGMGVLSQFLFKKDYNYHLIEIDEESVEYLEKHYPEHKDKIHFDDFLKINYSEYFSQEEFYIIGNFPYNISSQILFKIYENHQLVPGMVGMFQKEVAERIASKAGNKTYGILSVLLQAYYDIEYLFTVHENVFIPPPKVKSAVIRLTRLEKPLILKNQKLFKQIIKKSFNQRRKMLRNSIKDLISEAEMGEKFATKRPEQLSVEEFVQLTELVAKTRE